MFFPKKKGIFIVCAPFGDEKEKYSLADFGLPENLNKLKNQGRKMCFYHSKDDPVVPFAEMEKYKTKLLEAKFSIFEDRGHFGQEEFPEIIKDIQTLANNS